MVMRIVAAIAVVGSAAALTVVSRQSAVVSRQAASSSRQAAGGGRQAAADRSDDSGLSPLTSHLSPLSTYTSAIPSDLFGKPQPSSPARPAPKPAPPRPAPPVQALAPAPDPLGDWVYTGAVTLNGERLALLENRKMGDARYVRVGDEFEGFLVAGLSGGSVNLEQPGSNRQLALTDDFDLRPGKKPGNSGQQVASADAVRSLSVEAADPGRQQSVATYMVDSLGSSSSNRSIVQLYTLKSSVSGGGAASGTSELNVTPLTDSVQDLDTANVQLNYKSWTNTSTDATRSVKETKPPQRHIELPRPERVMLCGEPDLEGLTRA